MSTTPEGFEHHYADVNGVRLHYVAGGTGVPLVLLPGWPRTWWQYHKMMPALARRYRVIVCDLRGMGESSKPAAGYDKKNMARDIYELVSSLGHERVYIAGEDVGSWVAYNFAANFPDATIKAAFWGPGAPDEVLRRFPVVPRPGELSGWHLSFNALDELPEKLLAGRYRLLIDWYIDKLSDNPAAFDETTRAIYAAAYDSPEAIRAVAGWYGTLAEDIDEAATHTKLTMPVLVPDGDLMSFSRASNEHRATDIRFVQIPGAGHYLAEERPDELVRELLAFFG
ncbi:alpha/beta hydrolase [Catenulispora sp. NL8]|uniref:Alpha/beta hydrolase n=1 Tax=Catenulispora pinistramenti TaxID=2705254 RepID=A0ABS5KJT0_9ACTN|nr:alpha/beta hydrolase [Catenulispora pinistramenti]MBS2546412.1 alpha/beta hydrolase [Catenulispora pinistramenti]